MAITIEGAPDKLQPAFNPNYFYADSTNVNQQNFKYVLYIYSGSTNNKIFEGQYFPRPQDGLMEANVSRVLSNQVSTYFIPTIYSIVNSFQDFVYYDAQIGEIYTWYWPFSNETSDPNGTFFSASTGNNPFIVGDQVTITGTTNYNGNWTVLSANTNGFVANVTYVTNGQTGTSVYANFQTTVFTGLTASSGFTAWNGGQSFMDFQAYNQNEYILSTAAIGKFMTNMPSSQGNLGYTMNYDANAFVHFYALNFNNCKFLVIKTNNGGEYHYLNPITAATPFFLTAALGPNSLNNFAITPTVVSGPTTPIISSTTCYSAYTWSQSSAVTSQQLIINVNQKVDYRFTPYEILFMDRLGSYIPLTFTLMNKQTVSISNSQYQKIYGNFNAAGGGFVYNTWDRGRQNVNSTLIHEIELVSDWMNESMYGYLEELASSQHTYIKINGSYWAVVITEKNFPIKTRKNDQVINLTLKCEMAVSDVVQNIF
jgi:hypothetical protein